LSPASAQAAAPATAPALPVEVTVAPAQTAAPITAIAAAEAHSGERERAHYDWSLIAVGVLSLALAIAAAMWIGSRTVATRVTVAVLPFENLSADPDRAYLADGLAEDTIAALGQIDPDHVRVIGRTSTLPYKYTHTRLADIGRDLGVDFVVESSIRAEGARLRITAKLIRVADQVGVWSASFDREPTSMLGLQRELSAAIAEQIRLRISAARMTALARRQTADAEAYDLYLRGRNFDNQRTPATTKKAIEFYLAATARDPNYALAWAGLAQAYAGRIINSDVAPADAIEAARDAAARAVGAHPNLAEAQASLSMVKLMIDWDWAAAERAARRAVALDAGYPPGFRELGHILSQRERPDEARAALQRAREIDPLFAMNHAISSQVAFQARDYAAALAHARQSIIIDPEFWIGHFMAAQAYERLGDAEHALSAADAAARLSDSNSKALSLRGYVLATTGRTDAARDVLRTLEAAALLRYVPPYAIALVHAGLDDRDAALESLDRAVSVHDVHVIYLPVDAKWDAYRGDPRFTAVLARCGFNRSEPHPSGSDDR
jgi:TolB-like protein